MFEPSKKLLKNYADILVKFALNSGRGVKEGEVVQCLVPDVAKPMLRALQASVLESGAHPILRLMPTGLERPFYDLASKKQLIFFPKKYLKAKANLIDHSIGIIAEHDLHELEGVNPEKIMLAAESKKKYREWLFDKEYENRFTWTLALFATGALAKEAGLTLKEYWQQIIKACFLDFTDPISKWKKIFSEQKRVLSSLNSLSINKIHVQGKSVDLWISLGEKRKWVGGSGRNIPSFEIFTSPDWRGTEGYIKFNQPLYRYGNLIKEVELKFKDGKVVKASAKKGEKTLKAIVKRKNGDKIGEFSLTDSRASRITKFMANTLYDENIGGIYGNTHIAVGMSYKDAFDGNPRKIKKSQWKTMGFNESGEHCDIISTEDRTVTAHLKSGEKRVIYKQGKFRV
jgi:aminopeptidase